MTARRVPLGVRLAYTAFVAVLVPYYWHAYGPTNFLYYCDLALLMGLVAVWTERAIFASARRSASWSRRPSGWWTSSGRPAAGRWSA